MNDWNNFRRLRNKTISSQSSSPPLEKDGLVFVEEEEKANVLNNFFRDQTLLNDHDAVLPEIASYLVERCLSSLIFSPDEVKLILKFLPVGKASGISNRILSVLADEFSFPVCALFNSPYNMEPYLFVLKKVVFAQYPKVVIRQFPLIAC